MGFALWLAGCSGPPVTTPISGEPVCPDYELGATRTKMQGGLRYPVMLTIRDGSTTILKSMILGRRSEQDQPTRILLTDSNDKYDIEWAQCENERAPRPVTGRSEQKEASRFECGSAAVYANGMLATKKGDLSTHALAFAAPPKPECWMSDVAPPVAESDAGAPAGADAGDMADAGEAAADAGDAADAGADAGEGADAGSSGDAGSVEAATADAGSVDAGAKKKAGDEKKTKTEAKP